ncbi:peptidoglycan-binding protein [Streptomyces sp. MBT42]|uniref:peptidoglycan-binding protein n=1 Tax=Streptomyces sp. MBT42 TaxID=1488373 RepID=UPI001E3A1E56|nr:peptidoglycan-binding protein [Streptomyces sp. MBT42]MCD2462468.1 peptidoglycan-binding protein [Streptomyces sp. MBT42]
MSVNIISRSAWGARPWNGTPNSVSLSHRTEFFVHYDGGHPVGRTGNAVPKAIESVHINQGWSGVGYNFVIDQAGNIYEGRGWNLQGAHCPGHNVSGIGVQIAIGGDQEPSDKALAACRALYDEACRKTGRTLAKKGHKDGFATACPGPKLYAWVKAGMPAGDYDAPSTPAPEKPASWDGKSFPGASAFKLGQSHPAVTVLGQRLVAHGYGRFYKEGPGPRFTEADKDAVQAFQKAQGWTGSDADGYPGSSTWSRLMAAPKAASKPAPAKPKSTIVALNSAVKPGAKHAQVKELQQLLIKAGYGPIPGAPSTYYGPETQKAVARFHNKNVHLRSAGKSYDPAIGKHGFVELQKEAGRK